MSHNVERKDLDEKDALIDAIRQNNLTDVLHLIENGAEDNPQSRKWLEQPLHCAIYHGHEHMDTVFIQFRWPSLLTKKKY